MKSNQRAQDDGEEEGAERVGHEPHVAEAVPADRRELSIRRVEQPLRQHGARRLRQP